MDFDEAVHSHSQWKRVLRRGLAADDFGLLPADVSVDHKYVLGQWIYGEGASHSSLPEYTTLKVEHARFHLVDAELVRKANSGQSVDAEMEPCSTSEFSTSSSAVVIAVTAMKIRLVD